MNTAISNIAWDVTEDDAVADLMHRYGIAGIEVAPTKWWPQLQSVTSAEVAEYRVGWQARGFPIVALQSLLFGRPDLVLFATDEVREATISYLMQVIDIAAGLGAQAMVFGSPKNRQIGPMPYDDAFAVAVNVFRGLGEYSEKRGTVFCIEPNPTAYNCDFIRTTAEARALVEAVDHPGFRLHLDAGIMTMNDENVEEEIKASLPWLHHFHISEPQLSIIGSNTTNHKRFAAALRAVSYSGWVSVEMRNGWMSPDSMAVEQALKTVRQWYQE